MVTKRLIAILVSLSTCPLAAAEPVGNAANAKAKPALPAYVIQPPDVISIEMLRVIPVPPYRAEVFDVLEIHAKAPPYKPIDNYYMIEAEGTINLGPQYGSVRVAGMTVEEITKTLDKHLKQRIAKPELSVSIARTAGSQPVTGQYLVGPDGTINMRQYGVLKIAGKTVVEARIAIERHLKQFLDSPQVAVDVLACDSRWFTSSPVVSNVTSGSEAMSAAATQPVSGKAGPGSTAPVQTMGRGYNRNRNGI